MFDIKAVQQSIQRRKKAVAQALQNSSQHLLDKEFLEREKHMLYITQAHRDLSKLSAPLIAATAAYVEEHGLAVMEISLVPKRLLTKSDPQFEAHFEACCKHLQMYPKRTEILVCQQASPHVDDAYKGDVFRSVVLSTGNEAGYLVGCISEPAKRFGKDDSEDLSPTTTQLHVETGDEFVLNPQHIHYAMPLEMNPENLLILLQETLDDSTAQARKAIYEKFPPAKALANMKELSHLHF